MRCPFCGEPETKVNDSRLANNGDSVRRRRECIACGERYTTFETADLVIPRIVKRDGTHAPFDENKLRSGVMRALEKRPVEMDAIEALVNRLIRKLRATGDREVDSLQLGEWVMEELRELDEVAYVRFASVYRSFQDVEAFHKEIERLRSEPTSEMKKSQPSLLDEFERNGKRR